MDSLINKYKNYYYYEALDGHEADQLQQSVLEKHSNLVEFHQLVQQEVIDKVFTGPPELELDYIRGGRITRQEAQTRLAKYWEKYQSYIEIAK